jgi:hypothetical protein
MSNDVKHLRCLQELKIRKNQISICKWGEQDHDNVLASSSISPYRDHYGGPTAAESAVGRQAEGAAESAVPVCSRGCGGECSLSLCSLALYIRGCHRELQSLLLVSRTLNLAFFVMGAGNSVRL